MSHIKQIHTPIDPHEQYSKSSSKRLFDSVFKILDHDQLQISSFQQTDTNGSRIIKLLQNQHFIQAIIDKIKLQQLDQFYPILKVKCINNKGVVSAIDVDDLNTVFSKFGSLYTICQNHCQTSYYILFKSFSSAYVAMKLMNNFSLRHTCSSLYVEWCPSEQYNNMNYILNQYHLKIQWDVNEDLNKKDSNNQSLKQCKFTCRYDIQIENQKDFQVARRIIGSKGTNMKKIIQSALDQLNEKNSINLNQILKLRLRGRGSGYKEGPEQLQSQEQLHLCISAKDQAIYSYACQSVQKLLQNVYSEYLEYTRKQGRAINLPIKKSDLATQQPLQANNQNVMKNIDIPKNGRMEPEKIEQYLQLRNKARRQLNFAQADRIRNYLRACGVCLVDEKGRRGKAAEVTTWKYLL